jgi:hypothetical protein
MWTKIFLILLAVSFLAMSVLTYLSYAQLQSIGFAPRAIAESFLAYGGFYWTGLWISALALLILANVVLWFNRRAWALWATFLFFSLFVLVRTWWLNEVYVSYTKQNNLPAETLFGFGIIGVLMCIVAAVGIFFNQFLISRMRDRVHGDDIAAQKVVVAEDNPREEIVEEAPREENI